MSYAITDGCIGCTRCKTVCPVGAVSGRKKALHAIDDDLCIECGACGRICPKSCVQDEKGHGIARLKREVWPTPIIDTALCYACENCVDACPANALAMADAQLPLSDNYAVLADPGACVSCGWCVSNCMFDAIIMKGDA